MSLTGKSPSETYKDITYVDNDNNGVTTSLKQVKTGNGSNTALQVSDRSLQVKSTTDNTTALDVQNASGTSKLLVDTTNNYVKANGEHVNTQYAHFGIGSGDSVFAGALANNHYCIPFNGYSNQALAGMGTGTDPDTSLTISTTADDVTCCLWFIMDNITIDRVVWWSGADASSGDTTRCHLMSYDVDRNNTSASGDLSNGVVLADGSDITNAGYEQSYYQQMTIQSADVSAGKIVLFTFRSDSVNSDFSINATIKYHITG